MNHLKQSLQETNLNRISQITSHNSRQNAKHVISILSQAIRLSIHRNSELSLKYHQVVQKRKIAASEKAYNRHVLEKKQFTNKTFIFIHYRLLFQKYEHDSIFS
jgi:hypothetical protein